MEQRLATQKEADDENVIVAVNYCVNSNRTYIYELKDGDIINEKVIHGA
ncbi:MAG TPA: hypothetical protein VK436_00800 [Methanocella sp.]|nr:hypothetical protein [Methanocella sp.]